MGSFCVIFGVEEFFSVAVVSDNNEDTFVLVDGVGEAGEGEVDGLHGENGGADVGSVADHVAAGEIEADEFVVVEILDDGVGDFGGFHPGASFEGHGVAFDFDELFAGGLFVTVAIPVIGDVAELDGLGDGELGDTTHTEETT